MDPPRIRRSLGWLAGLARPRSAWWLHRSIWWGSLGYLLLAVGAWGLLWGTRDLCWPGTILLFGPRWVLLLPLSMLMPLALRRVRVWAEGFSGPHIVLGDFNTPPESRAYRREWADWRNAFSRAGRGLGGTRLNGWIKARIDHILVNRDLKVLEAWTGKDVGSDHLPVVARLRFR